MVLWTFCSLGPLSAQVCNDLVLISLDEQCTAAVSPDMVLEGGADDSTYTVQLFTSKGEPVGDTLTFSHLGDTVRAVVTHLPSGNSCWGRVVAVDGLAPLVHCEALSVPCVLPDLSPEFLQKAAGLSAAYAGVVEACGPYTLTHTDAVETFGCGQTQGLAARVRRTWVATDAAGNVGSCTQTIDVVRISLDSIAFPPDTALVCGQALPNLAAGGVPTVFFQQRRWPLLPALSACGLGIAYEDQPLPLCGGSYALLRTWTAYDDCQPLGSNNPARHVQTLRVEDKQGPQLSCPSDTVISTDPFACSRLWHLPEVLLSDACSGIASLSVRWSAAGVEQSQAGVLTTLGMPFVGALGTWAAPVHLPAGEAITFFYTATDSCGNAASCSFRVVVTDGSPPLVRCTQVTQVALGSSGEALVWAGTFDAGSEDPCAPVRFKARRADTSDCQANDRFFDRVRFCCADVGQSVPVILRVYDVAVDSGAVSLERFEQQANECLVEVQVVDKMRPVCTPPAPVQVSCANFDPSLWAYGMAQFADNCCVASVEELPPNYLAFDTLCSRGTIVRTFRGTDCHGLSTTCTQRVVVSYEVGYAIKFPDDLLIGDCDSTSTYPPKPEVLGANCARVGISYEDRAHQAGKLACYWIERTWRLVDWCRYNPSLPLVEVPNPTPVENPLDPLNFPGPVVGPPGFQPAPAVVRVRPDDPAPTDFSVFWSPSANGYLYRQIILIRDSVPPEFRGCPKGLVQVCDHTPNDPTLWNAPSWKHPLIPNSNDLCEVAVDLAATAQDLCSKGNINIQYRLFLDLDGDGVQETVVSSNNPPPPGMVRFGNAFTPDFAGGELRPFDQRPVPPEEKFRFTILRGGFVNISGFLRWNTEKAPTQYVLPQLPHGLHRIEWTADDGCGNRSVCGYDVEIRDCRPPDLVCMQGLNVTLPNGHPVSLNEQDFIMSLSDNCTPLFALRVGIRRAGAGVGFPVLPDGSPQKSVAFDCSDLGPQVVEVWAQDASGNNAICKPTIVVQDPFGECAVPSAQVAGALRTEGGQGLENALVTLSGHTLPGGTMSAISGASGGFHFASVPLGTDYWLTPSKDDDPLNGVSTYDLALLNQHIIGLKPLESPYKIIAADVNRSRSVTTFDILELRKLILGLYTHFPENTSWRFVPADFAFPNPSNPFQTIFPEARVLSALFADALAEHFVAIKVGDLNGNAITQSAHTAEARTAGTCKLWASLMSAEGAIGEVEVLFWIDTALQAFQVTVFHPGMSVEEITAGEGMRPEHFAVFAAQNAFTVAWDGMGTPSWRVRFRPAAAGGAAGQQLYLSDAITPIAAFTAEGTPLKVLLQFANETADADAALLTVHGCAPNPWQQYTQVSFSLAREAEVLLEVSNIAGQVLFSQKKKCAAGWHAFDLGSADWSMPPGAYFFRLVAEGESFLGKMLRQ